MDGIPASLRFPMTSPPVLGETSEIAPGVYWLRMKLPFALDHINLWLLEDGPGWTIVDAGYALHETKAAWERIFSESLGGRPVTRVLVTHYHPDHIGLAHWLCERWQVPLWVTEKEWLYARVMSQDGEGSGIVRREFARRAGLDAAAADVFGERQNGYRRGVPSVPTRFRRIADSMVIEIGGRDWRIVVGEGHAPELACLYCAETGVLISGDQVLPKISPNVSVGAHEPEADPLARFLVSLEKLRDLVPPKVLVLPSHNLPFYGLHTRLDELAAHHRSRCADIVAACTRPHSAKDLLPLLFRRPLDAHQTAFALGEAVAHLHYLMGLGAIERVNGDDGVDRFLTQTG
jgi:glyoxylase-like metal-dependent hydrolase (beta-lactamase superfamily II)